MGIIFFKKRNISKDVGEDESLYNVGGNVN
jgi:hypothetical protein